MKQLNTAVPKYGQSARAARLSHYGNIATKNLQPIAPCQLWTSAATHADGTAWPRSSRETNGRSPRDAQPAVADPRQGDRKRSCASWYSASFSRSASTTSSGALATNFSFDELPAMRAISSVTLATSFCSRASSAVEVDQAAERQADGRLADDDLRGALGGGISMADLARRAPAGRSPRRGARAASRVVSLAPTTTSGAIAAGGTFISERTERMPETSSISQLISAAASASSKSGCRPAAWQSRVARSSPCAAVRPTAPRS